MPPAACRQALLALEEYEAAKEAYERAASLDPSAKHKYQKLIQKCNTEIDGGCLPRAAVEHAIDLLGCSMSPREHLAKAFLCDPRGLGTIGNMT